RCSRFQIRFRFLLYRPGGYLTVQPAEEAISNLLAFPKRELTENRVKGILAKGSDAFVRIDPLPGDGLIPHHRNGLGPAIAVRGHQYAALIGSAGMAAETAWDIERVPPVPAAVFEEIKNRICICTHKKPSSIFAFGYAPPPKGRVHGFSEWFRKQLANGGR